MHTSTMLSGFTDSVRRKLSPHPVSPSGRRITLHADERPRRSSSQKVRPFFYYRDNHRHDPPRDADHTSSGEEDAEDDEEEEDEEDFSSSKSDEAPLLPIFSSDHLNSLPVFALTHAFREMVIERCDTVLTWDQLRSPQISQFLVKPIQQEIKDHHMNAATQYALLANTLQFNKEAGINPGNSGTNKTRALVCELIAIKLLRECNTRELIDTLSYDFDPLQGQLHEEAEAAPVQRRQNTARAARISCLEIAIRAGAKRFLSHPLVVQHLEAIWNGSIVFHSAADSMHRKRSTVLRNYGTHSHVVESAQPNSKSNRLATLYNPRDASLFKLSRLRVPRYRNILSTISFAILLLLFIAVLEDKSLEITTLELVFWAWAVGYMLDEVIGFNEQGFSLYLASFWNTFDVGILALLFVHLCLRLYGVVLPDDNTNKRYLAKLSYDILAASAVLLFPRLFSVLDHYRYFSQLIIAFRMMAADMVAIFVLIVIFCSGFLVALTFAFSRGDHTDTPGQVAYALLQMLLGFTPAAWDRWNNYNWLGKTVLVLFLFVCHFVVVTILITVLTNSFMEIVRNANEEHQFLFAVNVISNVKSDALFAYVPPFNAIQWLLTPLRYFLPFRQYLKVNRTIIKVTHLPILWTIYLYERVVLRPRYVDTVDLVNKRARVRKTFSERLPRLAREPSIATFRQDAALEQVFKQATLRTTDQRRKSSNVVNNWMTHMGDEDAEPPQEEDRKVVDKLERRRFGPRRWNSSIGRDFSASRRPTSVASDPNDLTSFVGFFSPRGILPAATDITPIALDVPSQRTDADGDDELLTNEHDEDDRSHSVSHHTRIDQDPGPTRRDYFPTERALGASQRDRESAAGERQRPDASRPHQAPGQPDFRPAHMRNASAATMIYHPPSESDQESTKPHMILVQSPKRSSVDFPYASPSSASKHSSVPSHRKFPKRTAPEPPSRPALPSKITNAAFRSTPDISNLLSKPRPKQASPGRPRRSSLEMDLVSDIGDNKAIGGGYVGAIPASFASHMAQATQAMRQSQMQLREQEEQRRNEDSERFGRLMMARMNTLEEGFREVVHEVREGMKQVGSGLVSRQRSPERPITTQKRPNRRFKDRHERSVPGSGAASGVSTEIEGGRPKTAGSGGNSSLGSGNNVVTSFEGTGEYQQSQEENKGAPQAQQQIIGAESTQPNDEDLDVSTRNETSDTVSDNKSQ